VQAGDEGDGGVAAVAELVGLQGGVPAALLFVQAAQQQVHLGVQFLVGVSVGLLTSRALAAVNFAGRHGESPSSGCERRCQYSEVLGTCCSEAPYLEATL